MRNKAFLLLSAVLAVFFLAKDLAAEESLQEGIDALKSGQKKTAVQIFRNLSEQGNRDAQYQLGFSYLSGEGVKKDEKKAFQWMNKAGQAGQPLAQFWLGSLYAEGKGVQKNIKEAMKWYSLAANAEVAAAQNALGQIYANGRKPNVKKDLSKAVHFLTKASNQSVVEAQLRLSKLYANGQGVEKDIIESYKWAILAAESGSKVAVEYREILNKKLNSQQRLKAKKLVDEWAKENKSES